MLLPELKQDPALALLLADEIDQWPMEFRCGIGIQHPLEEVLRLHGCADGMLNDLLTHDLVDDEEVRFRDRKGRNVAWRSDDAGFEFQADGYLVQLAKALLALQAQCRQQSARLRGLGQKPQRQAAVALKFGGFVLVSESELFVRQQEQGMGHVHESVLPDCAVVIEAFLGALSGGLSDLRERPFGVATTVIMLASDNERIGKKPDSCQSAHWQRYLVPLTV